MEVAEKIKLKLPIAENDLQNEDSSFWNKIECLNPPAINQEKPRKYFTAAYDSGIQTESFLKLFI